MAKRIIDLDNTNSPKSTMFLAVDQKQNDGAGTYRSSIHSVVGSVIGQGTASNKGGNSLKMTGSGNTYDICLKHTINIPAANSTEGGQVRMYFNDGKSASVDTFVDSAAAYKTVDGNKIGANRRWFRVLVPDSSGNEYGALLIDCNSGELYKPLSKSAPMTLVPIGGSDSGLGEKISELEQRVNALRGAKAPVGGAHVAETPPSTLTTGGLWWDTNTARLYVYDGTSWVVTIP